MRTNTARALITLSSIALIVFGYFASTALAAPVAPIVQGNNAKTVENDSATIQALINPGELSTSVTIHYATDAYYQANGQTYSDASVATPMPETDNALHTFARELGGLPNDTLIHYSTEACNTEGCDSSADKTFTTGPSSITGPLIPEVYSQTVSSFTQTSAIFDGWMTPNYGATTVRVEYATDAYWQANGTYNQISAGSSLGPGATDGGIYAHSVTIPGGLSEGTLYHWRFAPCNVSGCDTSAPDQTFTTAGTPAIAPQIVAVQGGATGTTTAAFLAGVFSGGETADCNLEIVAASGSGPYATPTLIPCMPASFVSPPGVPQGVEVQVSGLLEGTTYLARFIASNTVGTVSSTQISITTSTTPLPPVPGLPLAFIFGKPAPLTSNPLAVFTFGGQNIVRYECQVDAAGWQTCPENFSTTVAPGDHQILLRGYNSIGQVSPEDTEYWTTALPNQCKVSTLRARTFVFTEQNRFRMVERYTSRKKIKNVEATFFVTTKSGKRIKLGETETDFKKAGVVRIQQKVDPATMKKLRAAKHFRVNLKVPGTAASCTKLYSRTLNVTKEVAGQLVWFQSDSVFTPTWGAVKGTN